MRVVHENLCDLLTHLADGGCPTGVEQSEQRRLRCLASAAPTACCTVPVLGAGCRKAGAGGSVVRFTGAVHTAGVLGG